MVVVRSKLPAPSVVAVALSSVVETVAPRERFEVTRGPRAQSYAGRRRAGTSPPAQKSRARRPSPADHDESLLAAEEIGLRRDHRAAGHRGADRSDVPGRCRHRCRRRPRPPRSAGGTATAAGRASAGGAAPLPAAAAACAAVAKFVCVIAAVATWPCIAAVTLTCTAPAAVGVSPAAVACPAALVTTVNVDPLPKDGAGAADRERHGGAGDGQVVAIANFDDRRDRRLLLDDVHRAFAGNHHDLQIAHRRALLPGCDCRREARNQRRRSGFV